MTTRLPIIPPEYEGRLYWTDDDAESMALRISQVLAIPVAERRATATAGRELARSRNPRAQGSRIMAFVDSLRPSP